MERSKRILERMVGMDGLPLYETQYMYQYDSYSNIVQRQANYYSYYPDFERDNTR